MICGVHGEDDILHKCKVPEEIQNQDKPEGTGEPFVVQKSWVHLSQRRGCGKRKLER